MLFDKCSIDWNKPSIGLHLKKIQLCMKDNFLNFLGIDMPYRYNHILHRYGCSKLAPAERYRPSTHPVQSDDVSAEHFEQDESHCMHILSELLEQNPAGQFVMHSEL